MGAEARGSRGEVVGRIGLLVAGRRAQGAGRRAQGARRRVQGRGPAQGAHTRRARACSGVATRRRWPASAAESHSEYARPGCAVPSSWCAESLTAIAHGGTPCREAKHAASRGPHANGASLYIKKDGGVRSTGTGAHEAPPALDAAAVFDEARSAVLLTHAVELLVEVANPA